MKLLLVFALLVTHVLCTMNSNSYGTPSAGKFFYVQLTQDAVATVNIPTPANTLLYSATETCGSYSGTTGDWQVTEPPCTLCLQLQVYPSPTTSVITIASSPAGAFTPLNLHIAGKVNVGISSPVSSTTAATPFTVTATIANQESYVAPTSCSETAVSGAEPTTVSVLVPLPSSGYTLSSYSIQGSSSCQTGNYDPTTGIWNVLTSGTVKYANDCSLAITGQFNFPPTIPNYTFSATIQGFGGTFENDASATTSASQTVSVYDRWNTTPNGNWKMYSTQKISWEAFGVVENVMIYLLQGSNRIPIVSSTGGSFYNWAPHGLIPGTYTLIVASVPAGTVYRFSPTINISPSF